MNHVISASAILARTPLQVHLVVHHLHTSFSFPGAAVGLVVSVAATRWIESFLFGVKRLDLMTRMAAFSVLIVVALAAAFVPAWRAAHVDPTTALRAE